MQNEAIKEYDETYEELEKDAEMAYKGSNTKATKSFKIGSFSQKISASAGVWD